MTPVFPLVGRVDLRSYSLGGFTATMESLQASYGNTPCRKCAPKVPHLQYELPEPSRFIGSDVSTQLRHLHDLAVPRWASKHTQHRLAAGATASSDIIIFIH